jgi:hypothetical protein
MAITVSCVDDIRNFFTRAQYTLDKDFAILEGVMGAWEGKIPSAGSFPIGSGWAARTTVLGFNRPRVTGAPRFQPMVGLQDDCVGSCTTPTTTIKLGNADHKWYRMAEYAENTEVYCLTKMLGDALNLDAQIKNHIRIMKMRTMEIYDEYYRANQAILSENKWLGIDGSTPRRGLWRFEEDANGTVNVNKIILDTSVTAGNVSLLTQDFLNRIRLQGTYRGAFTKEGQAPLITDYETMSEIPKQDANTRMDNRYRDPDKLNPGLGAIGSYGNWDYHWDPFAMRYYWDLADPNYPNGVLTRIDHWQENPVSEGCFDDVADDYLNADFQISFPFNPTVYGVQNLLLPTPTDTPASQPASPYHGLWRFINEVNEVTPCNQDRDLFYWRMVMKAAAKPENRYLGHVVLHRLYGRTGTIKACRDLMVPTGGSYSCDPTCAPFDHYPPALVTRTVCGKSNQEAGSCA